MIILFFFCFCVYEIISGVDQTGSARGCALNFTTCILISFDDVHDVYRRIVALSCSACVF